MKEVGYGLPSRTIQVARALWSSGYLHTKGPSSEAASSTCSQTGEIMVILLSCRVPTAGIPFGSNLQVNSARGLRTSADLRRLFFVCRCEVGNANQQQAAPTEDR